MNTTTPLTPASVGALKLPSPSASQAEYLRKWRARGALLRVLATADSWLVDYSDLRLAGLESLRELERVVRARIAVRKRVIAGLKRRGLVEMVENEQPAGEL